MLDADQNGGELTGERRGWSAWGRSEMLWNILRLLLLAAVIAASVGGGLWVRDKTWTWTYAIRFHGDINNALRWGTEANAVGYFSLYESLGTPEQHRRRIDYAPLRLGLMTWWVSQMRESRDDPLPAEREPSLEFHRPLMLFNTLIGLAAATGAFLVARHVARWRLARPPSDDHNPGFWAGTWIGLVVAILVWFNPLILLNAHAWPQWDVWPMPFFFFALYCCLRRWWLVAGVLLGIGATLKGQILMVAWVLPVFALFIGDWRGAIRILVGLGSGIMLVGLPWVVTRWVPDHVPASAFDLFERKINWFAMLFITSQILIAAVVPVVIRRRVWPTAIAFAFASSAWLSMVHFGGTDNWLMSGFGVGTWNYQAMYMGTTSNLAALLTTFGWEDLREQMLNVSGIDITMRSLLLIIFFTLCLICAAAAAVRHRQRDARAVIALCLPWLLFYAIPGQIHERYLLYIAVCAPLFLCCGFGWFMLGCVFVLMGFISTIHTAINSNGIRVAQWSDLPPLPWEHTPIELWGFIRYLVTPTHPGIAWALLMGVAIAMVGLWSRRRGGTVHADH